MSRTALILAALLAASLPLAADEALTPGVVVSALDADEKHPQAAYNSARDEFLVVWSDDWNVVSPGDPFRSVLGRRLDRYGRPLGPAFQISPTGDDRDRVQPAVAYDRINDRYLVTYIYDYYGDGSDWDIRGRFVTWNGAPVLSELGIAASTRNEWRPRVAFTAGKYLVTWWEEYPGGYARAMGSLVVYGISPGAPFTIAGHASQNRLRPDVSPDPVGFPGFLVVYDNGLQVFGRLVGTTGNLGPESTLVSGFAGASAPAVGHCRGALRYLLVWETTFSPTNTAIYGRFLKIDGTVDGDAFLIDDTPILERRPAVSCPEDGMEYLVVMEGQYSSPSGSFGIHGRRVRFGPALRPWFQVRPWYIGETGDPNSWPAVAGGTAGWLVVWEYDRQTAPYYQDIRNRVVWQLFADGFEWGNTSQWSSP